MRKCFVIFVLLYGHTSICQVDSIYARIEIKSVSQEKIRSKIKPPVIITLDKLGHSDIISLGEIDGTEIGIQVELITSQLGDSNIFVIGKAFYLKKDGRWQMHFQPSYQTAAFKIVSSKPSKMPEDYGEASTGIQDLQVNYKEHYFIIRSSTRN